MGMKPLSFKLDSDSKSATNEKLFKSKRKPEMELEGMKNHAILVDSR